jgi:hypothetical protein
MNFNKQLLEGLKSVVLKDFKTHTKDKGGSCIEEACLQVFHPNKNKYIDFIEQWEVCESQGNNAIIDALKEAEQITNKLFPSLKTNIHHGRLD